MSVGKVIKTVLVADGDVNGVISGKIYPNIVIQGKTPPYVAYRINDVEPHDTKDGVSTVDLFDVTVACFAKQYGTCDDLASKIRTAIDGYSGTPNSINVNQVLFLDRTDTYDNAGKMHIIEQDFSIRIHN